MAAEMVEAEALCVDLAHELSGRFVKGGEWDRTSRWIIQALRSVGHDLWSFDEDTDFQRWCGDWSRPDVDGGLTLEFRAPDYVQVSWRSRTDAGDVVTAEAGTPSKTAEQG